MKDYEIIVIGLISSCFCGKWICIYLVWMLMFFIVFFVCVKGMFDVKKFILIIKMLYVDE